MSENDKKERLLDKVLQIFRKKKEEGDFDEDDQDEDDDQRFIKKNAELEEVYEELKEDLDSEKKKLEGVRPEGNQQRDLNRETGGLEAEIDKGISEKDVWDDRHAQIEQMIEDEQDLNNPSKSSRNQSFIHRKKQEKKNRKENEKAAQDSFENMGYVARVRNMRKDRSTIDSKGGSGMSM
ncbi:MAG TPA: hypothetical protein VI861_04125 [Rickettsiales bacterium]|nr:hypothetical protein [Rickettsiales bacterium]